MKTRMNAGRRFIADFFFEKGAFVSTFFFCVVLGLMAAALFYKSLPILEQNKFLDIIVSSVWQPLKGKFGMLPFIISTVNVTLIALLIALPCCMLSSVFLSEYAPSSVVRASKPVLDILSGIPSVVFGLWGVIVIVPFVRDSVAPFFGLKSTGYCLLSGGIVLSVMIMPVIIHTICEVMTSVEHELREASLSLGATKWETVKLVVIRKSMPGIIAAFVLGLSRAFGETLAVLMVVGNIPKIPGSVFDGGYPIPALVANNYGEMMSVPLYDSALMLASFVLFIIVALFNIVSRYILAKAHKNTGGHL